MKAKRKPKEKRKIMFKIDCIDDRRELLHYLKAGDYFSALCTFSEEVLRMGRKRGFFKEKEISSDKVDFISEIEEEFYKILDEYGINLHE